MPYSGQIIDGHLHVSDWFDSEGKDFYRGFDEVESRRGVRAINIAGIPIGEYGPANNMIAALYKLHNPRAFIHGGLIYPEYPVRELPCGSDPLTQYNELMEIGFDGIKLLDTKPNYHKEIACPLDLPLFAPFFAQADADGTHVLWHVCDPEEFWDINKITKYQIELGWYYGDGTYATNDEIYGQVFNVLKANPNLKATFTHFFFYSAKPRELEKLFETFPNLCVDITPGTEMYVNFTRESEYYREFFTKYSDRILFGTDTYFPNSSDAIYNNVIKFLTTDEEVSVHGTSARGLDLSEEVCGNILCNNFVRRVSEKPKEMNAKALKRYINKYRGWIKDRELFELVTKAGEEL